MSKRNLLWGAVPSMVWAMASVVHAATPLGFEVGPGAPAWAAIGSLAILAAIFGLATYIYFSLALQTIARETNVKDAWLAWIPLVNIVLMLNIAKKPVWWIILFFVPLINLVITVVVWMAIAKARQKPGWLGILILVPLMNLIVPGYLAWGS